VIRHCYSSLWDVIEASLDGIKSNVDDHVNVALTGQPGIGKTVGVLNFLLLKMLEKEPTVPVVAVTSAYMELYLPQVGGTVKRLVAERLVADHRNILVQTTKSWKDELHSKDVVLPHGVAKPPLLLLYDVKTLHNLHFDTALHDVLHATFKVVAVCCASPNPINFKDFGKQIGLQRSFYLGAYSEADMRHYCRAVLEFDVSVGAAVGTAGTAGQRKHDAAFEKHFALAGGVPRYWSRPDRPLLAAKKVESLQAEAIARIANAMQADFRIAFRPPSESLLSPSALVCGIPNDSGTEWQHFDFVSRVAAETCVRVMFQSNRPLLAQYVASPDLTGDVRGRIFEIAALQALQVSEMRARVLGLHIDDSDFEVVPGFTGGTPLTLPAAAAGKRKGRMYVPAASNNPFWDAIVVYTDSTPSAPTPRGACVLQTKICAPPG